jgi:hypothetical protein
VESYPGSLYLSQDRSLGIFVKHEVNVAVKESIDKVLNGASTAGPRLDRDVLRNLSRIVGEPNERQDENGPPTVLSHAEALHFEAIRAQFFLRDDLPNRIKRTCQVCHNTTVEDPAQLAQRAADAQRSYERNRFIDRLAAQSLSNSGHPVEGLMRMLYTPPKPSLDIFCPVCNGKNFDRARVTFCPECHNLRDESLLIQCPQCDYDFVAPVREHIWTTSANALREFNVSYKYSAVSNAARALDINMNNGQMKFLAGHITADTSIFGVARCRLIDNRKRNTLLLVTSAGICWCSRIYLVFAPGGSLKWAEVASAARTSNAIDDVRLTSRAGRTVTFGSFTGGGKALGIGVPGGVKAFDPQAIRQLIARMRG